MTFVTVRKQNLKLLDQIKSNKFDKNSLYVFFNDEAWEHVSKNNPSLIKIIDANV